MHPVQRAKQRRRQLAKRCNDLRRALVRRRRHRAARACSLGQHASNGRTAPAMLWLQVADAVFVPVALGPDEPHLHRLNQEPKP